MGLKRGFTALAGLLASVLILASCVTYEPLHKAPPYGNLAVNHVRFMNDNLYGRVAFSYRELEAALWIVEELLYMGQLAGSDIRDFSQNVILTVPGQNDQVIVVGAHYDSFPYPGASDNASGTALLLESAQRILSLDNYHTIVYVFFGAEGAGLLGAHYFVDPLTDHQREDLLFMVNADVLFEGPYTVYAAGFGNRGLPGANYITRQLDYIAYGVSQKLRAYDIDIDLIAYPNGIYRGSDQLVFLGEGYTVVFLMGVYTNADGAFVGRVLHSYRDCYHYIEEAWPGKIERNMRVFAVFLEEILLARY